MKVTRLRTERAGSFKSGSRLRSWTPKFMAT